VGSVGSAFCLGLWLLFVPYTRFELCLGCFDEWVGCVVCFGVFWCVSSEGVLVGG